MQGRVEQRGMDPVRGSLLPHLLRQRDLGEHLLAEPPGRPQPLEGGPVSVTGVRGVRVEVGHGQGLGPGGRPHRAGKRDVGTVGVARHGEHGTGMPRPRGLTAVVAVAVAVRPRVHAQFAPPLRVGCPEHELEPHAPAFRQEERCLQSELLDQITAGLVPGTQRQFDEGRTRQQDGPGDRVVRQPRQGLPGQPPGQEDPVLAGQPESRTEQGMTGTLQAQQGRVTGRPLRGFQPVPFALEGVRGQIHRTRTAPAQHADPVDAHPAHPRHGERRPETVDPAFVTP